MPKIVEVADGGKTFEVEFPDDASPQEIEGALRRNYPPPDQQEMGPDSWDVPPNVPESPSALSQLGNAARTFASTLGEQGLSTAQGAIYAMHPEAAKPRAQLESEKAAALAEPTGLDAYLKGPGFDRPSIEVQAQRSFAATEGLKAKDSAEFFANAQAELPAQYGVDPALEKTLPARVAKGLAQGTGAAAIGIIPGIGLPAMAAQGALSTYAEGIKAGKTPQDAEDAAVRSLIGLAVFGAQAKVVSAGLSAALGEGAGAVKTFLTQFAGQTAANELTGHVLSAWEAAAEAPEGKKLEAAKNAFEQFSPEGIAQSVGFGAMGAAHATADRPAEPAGNIELSEENRQLQELTGRPEAQPGGAQTRNEEKPGGGQAESPTRPVDEEAKSVPLKAAESLLGPLAETPKGQDEKPTSEVSGGTEPIPPDGEQAAIADPAGSGANLGPGAANIEEFPPKQNLGMYNATADKQMEAIGFDPLFSVAQKEGGQAWNDAEKMIEDNPNLPAQLVNSINSGERTTGATPEENNVIKWRLIDLTNQRDQALERINDESISHEERVDAESQVTWAEKELLETYKASRSTGTVQSASLNSRRGLINRDFTYLGMTGRERMAKGEALSSTELTKIRVESEAIQKSNEALANREKELDDQAAIKATDEAIPDLVEEAKRDTRSDVNYDPRILQKAEQWVANLESKADKAWKEIQRELGISTNIGVPISLIPKLAIVGAAKIARGGLDFARWSSKMIEQVGEIIKPNLEDIWIASNKLIDEGFGFKGTPEQKEKVVRNKQTNEDRKQRSIEGIKKRLEEGDSIEDLGRYIRNLAKNAIRDGVRGRDNIVNRVHEDIKGVAPDVTVRQVQDGIAGRGQKFKELSKEEADIEYRTVRGELQHVVNIKDLEKGILPPKLGFERHTPGDEQRRLKKIENELKKNGNFAVTDPATQHKRSIDTIKARLRNEIADLDFAISEGRSIPKKGRTKYGEEDGDEIQELRDKRAEKKAQYDEMFPKQPLPEEQQLAAAARSLDRSIANLEADLKAGKLYKEKGVKKLTSDELKAKNLRLASLRAERDLLRSLDTERVEAAKENKIQDEIDRLKAGPSEEKASTATVDTEKLAALKAEKAAIQKAQADAKKSPVKTEDEKRDANLEKQLADKKEQLRTGAIDPKTGRPTADTEKQAVLRAEINAINKEITDRRKGPQKTEEEKRVESLDKQIKALEDKIAAGDTSVRTGKPSVPTQGEAVREARLKELNKQLAELRRGPRKTKEEIAIKSFKARKLREAADLKDRMARGDFAKKKKREPLDISKDPEAVKIKAEGDTVKRDFAKRQFDWEQAKRTRAAKVLDGIGEVWSSFRTVKTAYDVGATFRQGAVFSLGDVVFNPARFARQQRRQYGALFSEKKFQENESRRSLRPNAQSGFYEKSGLYLSDIDGKLTNREETMRSNWAEKVPGVRASNRAYADLLNEQRADAFDAFVNAMGGADKVTDAQAKFLASAVNEMTGRGSLGEGAHVKSMDLLAKFLFSPRFLISRIKLLFGEPVLRGIIRGEPVGAKVRALVALQYGKTAIGVAAFVGLAAQLPGVTVSLDATSSDFLKIKIGNTRLDPFFGLQQFAVTAYRAFKHEYKDASGKKRKFDLRALAGFARSKAAPGAGTAVNLLLREDFTGQPITAKGELVNAVAPISWGDVISMYKEQGPYVGTVLQILNLKGMGMQHYEPREKKARASSSSFGRLPKNW